MPLSRPPSFRRPRRAAGTSARRGTSRRGRPAPSPAPSLSPGLSPGLALAACLLASGCAVPVGGGAGAGGTYRDGPGDLVLAAASVAEEVRDLPKARHGNMREYTVRGRRYRTLDSASGYRERGVASWYGAKFHGRPTSSGEPFDMHALTAAHRHLPLPTFVRVTNVDTGAAVIVRVNDRGPFVDDRAIDLSYAAALRLGMLERGTAEVEIEALSTHVPAAARGEGRSDAAPDTTPDEPLAAASRADAHGAGASEARPRFVQLGAFASGANAAALARRAAPHLAERPSVHRDEARALYRVRVGPIADEAALRSVLAGLAAAGIESYTLSAPSR